MGGDYEKYRGDVIHDVWRWGGDPDAIDEEFMMDYFCDGIDPEDCADAWLGEESGFDFGGDDDAW